MAFRIECVLDHMEYRGIQSGTSTKTGKPWLSLVLEDPKCNQVSVSVSQEMQGEVYSLGLTKGDKLRVPVVCSATANGNSYVMLNGDIEPDVEGVEW